MSGDGTTISVDLWNVGQGDASSIRLPSGELILIDVGPKNSTISQWLRSGPRGTINAIILTHNDADHAGALPEIAADPSVPLQHIFMLEDRDRSDPRTTALFRPVFGYAARRGYTVERLECPPAQPRILWEDIRLGFVLRLRHPAFSGNAQSRSPNDASAVLTLDSPVGTMLIWPGDAYVSQIAQVAPRQPRLLFGPHHGAPQDRKNERFLLTLASLSPHACFISVGTKNHKDKHPNTAYVERLSVGGCDIFCSQMTRNCNPARVNAGTHLMNTGGYFGLPAPAAGVFCRGHVRVTITVDNLVFDRYHDEHKKRLKEERRKGRKFLCMPK